MKEGISGLVVGLVILLAAWFFGLFGVPYQINQLTKENNGIKSEIKKISSKNEILEKNYSYLIGYLSGKFGINLSKFIAISNEKNLTQKKVTKGIEVLSTKNKQNAQMYLQHDLKFTPYEARSIFAPPTFQNHDLKKKRNN